VSGYRPMHLRFLTRSSRAGYSTTSARSTADSQLIRLYRLPLGGFLLAPRNDDEVLTPFSTHQLICPSCQCAAHTFACDDGQITGTFPRVFCPHEGRFAIVTKRWPEDAVDATGASDERACRGRRSHVVLTPRRWRQILKKLALLRDDGDKKARSPGRAWNKPLKPLRGECRIDPA
jgi:hypothetical protein